MVTARFGSIISLVTAIIICGTSVAAAQTIRMGIVSSDAGASSPPAHPPLHPELLRTAHMGGGGIGAPASSTRPLTPRPVEILHPENDWRNGSSTGATTTDIRTMMKEKRDQFMTDLKTERDAIKGKVKAAVADQMNNIVQKLTNTLSQLGDVLMKIDSRIDKFSTGGVDTTAAKDASDKAKVAIDGAKGAIDAVYTILQTTASSTSPRSKLPAVKSAVQAANDAIKGARKAIEDAAQELRKLSQASSSPATTTQQ